LPETRCPYLLKRAAYHCCTVNESYCPSNFQLREYCTTVLFKICPFYLGYHLNQNVRKEEMTQKKLH
jgi:hypothetical protein